jgi:hypothetical protein
MSQGCYFKDEISTVRVGVRAGVCVDWRPVEGMIWVEEECG